jgi:DNA invertase Pin-like site-specific DNA recombinase
MNRDRVQHEGESNRLVRAAQYVRMSTEHQRYSTENQADAIAAYAARRGFEIVQTYEDSGKSGLRLDGRAALQKLIADVRNGLADFKAILVYDVSRWGRFQDADESAYYEFICREAGIAVHYCAEQFENDGSLSTTVIKSMKRAMAGEYSRELSAKVFAGQCRLITLGFRQGGPAGYGLRRQLIDEHGNPKAILSRGEHKSFQTDRVVLTPGPPEEVEVVRRLYRLFVLQQRSETEIAGQLNAEGLLTDLGQPWSRAGLSFSPDWKRRGVRPKCAPTVRELLKRAGSSTAALKLSAVISPTPGMPMNRTQTSSSWAAFLRTLLAKRPAETVVS